MDSRYHRIIKRQAIVWTIAWSVYRLIRGYGRSAEDTPNWLESMELIKTLAMYVLIGMASGLFFGSYEYIYQKFRPKNMTFGGTLALGAAGYLVVIVIFFSCLFTVLNLFFEADLDGNSLFRYFTKGGGIVAIVFCFIVGLGIEFVKEVDKKFGPGNLIRMITGQFFTPKEEVRIFMFLDLRSSTHIAERLGHIQYSKFIQDCFKDLHVITKYKAEIYQYAGDEVILSWKKDDGIGQNRCIRMFYAYLDVLEEKHEHYMSNYGHFPEFKAGMNLGTVTIAEVGEIKREIAFHGDTLNTAARIQAKCNEYDANLLISGELKNALDLNYEFSWEQIGNLNLKGKEQLTSIFRIRKVNNSIPVVENQQTRTQ